MRLTRTRRSIAAVLLGAVALLGAACGSSPSGSPNGGSNSATTAPGGNNPGNGSGPKATTGGGSSSTSSTPSSTSVAPTSTLADALTTAYKTETGALATYQNVISTLGSVKPFANVVSSEQQHVATLTNLMAEYGVSLPQASAGQSSPSTLSLACDLGVSTEQHVIAMYDAAMEKVTDYADVSHAFATMRSTSAENHLPAFQHC